MAAGPKLVTQRIVKILKLSTNRFTTIFFFYYLLHSLAYTLCCRLVTSFFFKRHYYLFYYLLYYYLLLILLNIQYNVQQQTHPGTYSCACVFFMDS